MLILYLADSYLYSARTIAEFVTIKVTDFASNFAIKHTTNTVNCSSAFTVVTRTRTTTIT